MTNRLCTTSSFYYIFFILTSPFLIPFFIACQIILFLFRRKTMAIPCCGLLFLLFIRLLFCHSFYPMISAVILHYPLSTLVYVIGCFITMFCVISSYLNRFTKKHIQQMFTLLHLSCFVLIVNSTASVSVGISIVLVVLFTAFITKRLKFSYL